MQFITASKTFRSIDSYLVMNVSISIRSFTEILIYWLPISGNYFSPQQKHPKICSFISLFLSLTLTLSSLSPSLYHSVNSSILLFHSYFLSPSFPHSLPPYVTSLYLYLSSISLSIPLALCIPFSVTLLFLPPSISLLFPPSYFHLLFLSPFINLLLLYFSFSLYFSYFSRVLSFSHSLPLSPRLLLSRPLYPFPAFPFLSSVRTFPPSVTLSLVLAPFLSFSLYIFSSFVRFLSRVSSISPSLYLSSPLFLFYSMATALFLKCCLGLNTYLQRKMTEKISLFNVSQMRSHY